MLRLEAREGFGKSVSSHLVGGTIDEFDRAGLDDVTNKMVPNIDVFRARVIVAVTGEGDGRFAVRENSCGFVEGSEELADEATKPNCFLRGLCGCDVLGLGGRERHKLLLLRRPGNGSAVDEEDVAGDRVSVILGGAVGVDISLNSAVLAAVDELEFLRAFEVAKYLFDGFPVLPARIFTKSGNGGDSEFNVGAGSRRGVVQ